MKIKLMKRMKSSILTPEFHANIEHEITHPNIRI